MTDIGHNSSSIAQGQLKSFIQRIERLHEEKKAIEGDLKEVFAEAKATGFDTKIMKKVVQLRRKDAAERQEEDALLDLYMSALGMNTDAMAGPPPRLARPEPSQAPVGAQAAPDAAADASCKPAAPGATGIAMQADEAGEAATIQQKPSEAEVELPPSPAEADDGAGEVSDIPVTPTPATNSQPDHSSGGEQAVDAAAGVQADPPAAAPSSDDEDPLAIPDFMRRTPG